jgi:hypothetical protein
MKTSDDDVIILVERNLSALTMVFGELTPSQLEEKKAFAKIVSSLNQIKMESFQKETNKGEMSTTALASMGVSAPRIRPIFEFEIDKML